MLEYAMGLRAPSNKKANLGTIVHKAMEILARYKKAKQEGHSSYDDEYLGVIQLDVITPEWAATRAYEYYIATDDFIDCGWSNSDLRTCIEWTQAIIGFNKGQFDPRNRTIIEPEQRFDFTIDKPWAHYDYVINGETVSGQLGLKGTMDLVVQDEPGLIEVIDYKTGRREDWAKNWKLPYSAHVKKTYKDLRYDPQLCLYHYAACHLFPESEEVFVTIIFINDGGPYTLCFDRSDVEFTERIIRTKFEEIKNTGCPILNRSWKCSKFCHYGKTQSEEDSTKTMCEFFRDKAKEIGIDETIQKYGKEKAWEAYGGGGGRQSP